ncbi:MAG: AAA family ATPase [Clostridia bacterium]|nr:AAA family ATPase [Clostridia bacterium]
MMITKLEMTRFGQFRGKEVELANGLNVYRMDNEAGKTTTADFIRFMFYGLPHRGRKALSLQEDLLEKYQPWDSEEGICGALEWIDEKGKFWRVERTQNRKGKGEHRVLDDRGRPVEVADVGRAFLGLDSDTFASVFFLREGSVFRRTEQMEIAMRNLVTTGDESVGYDTVMAYLMKQRGLYVSATGTGGPLKRLEETIALGQQQIAVQQSSLDKERAALGQEEDPTEQLSVCERALADLEIIEKQAKKYEDHRRFLTYRGLEIQAEELLAQIECSNRGLSEEQIRQLREGFAEREGGEYLLAQAERTLSELQQTAPSLSERDEQILALEGAERIGGGQIAAIVGAGIFTVAALVAALRWHPWCWAAVSVGALLTVGALWWARRPSKRITALGLRSRAGLRTELAVVRDLQAQIRQFQREQAAAVKRVEECKEHLQTLARKYGPLQRQTGIADRETLERILKEEMQVDVLRERLQHIYVQMDRLGEVVPVERTDPPALSLEQVHQRQAELRSQKDRLQSKCVKRATYVAELERGEAELAAKKNELEENRRQAEAMRREYHIVTLAIEQMAAAQEKLRENYAPRLCAAMSEKLAWLTDGKYDTVMLDEELSVRIKADGGMRALGYFSSGTADAALLALRLSLAEILETDHKIPMIFDDPFLRLDPTRLSVLKEYLEKAGKERQILLMSCKDF